MTGEDDVLTPRVELRPHAHAGLVGLPAKQLCVDRLHKGVHAIEAFGSRTGRQPFQITIRARDVSVRAGSDVDDDLSVFCFHSLLHWKVGKRNVRLLSGWFAEAENVPVEILDVEIPTRPRPLFQRSSDYCSA